MKEQAIEKIKGEMDRNKDSNILTIGNFLIQYLSSNPDAAEKILNSEKTIKKSLDAMRGVAEKEARVRQKNGHYTAVIPDSEGFAIVLKYFDITGSASAPTASVPLKKSSDDFNINLEDLL
jgi:hypothetical protein